MRKSIRVAITACLALCMLLYATGIAFAQMQDIRNHWAENDIKTWIERGLIQGFPDGTFKPENPITRAELFALLNRSFGFIRTADFEISDVSPSDWFTEEALKAKAQGYLDVLTGDALNPNQPANRQEVVTILGKILKLKPSEDAAERFTDAGMFAPWAKGYIRAVVEFGYIKGYTDNTFGPEKNISRAEVVAVLHRAIGELYNTAGVYGPEGIVETVTGNVTVSRPDITLRNLVIDGNLYLTEGIGDGAVILDNVTVMGTTTVSGGEQGIVFKDSIIGEVVVSSPYTSTLYIVAEGSTEVGTVLVQSDAKIEERSCNGPGFGEVLLEGPQGVNMVLAGDFDRVLVTADLSRVSVLTGTIKLMEIDGKDTVITAGKPVRIDTLTINKPAEVNGKCSIGTANINSSNVVIETEPEVVNKARGITDVVIGYVTVIGGSGGGSGGGGSPSITVKSVEPIGDIFVTLGTGLADITFPRKVGIVLSNKTNQTVDVTWNLALSGYDGDMAGTYTFNGTVKLPRGVTNPNNKKAFVNVHVKPAVGTYTVSEIHDFAAALSIEVTGVLDASCFNVYHKPNETTVNPSGKPVAEDYQLISLPQVFADINDIEIWVYSDAEGSSLVAELCLAGDDNTGDLVLKTGTLAVVTVTDVADIDGISVPYGTAYEDIGLPDSVEVTLSDGTNMNTAVEWDGGRLENNGDIAEYDGETSGTYIFSGTLLLPKGIENTGEIVAEITVTVEEPEAEMTIMTEIITEEHGEEPDQTAQDEESGQQEDMQVEPDGEIPGGEADEPAETEQEQQDSRQTILIRAADIDDISVTYGTAFEDIGLPDSVEATLIDGTILVVEVTWDSGRPEYDGNAAGDYIFTGTMLLPDGTENPDRLGAEIKVTVEESLEQDDSGTKPQQFLGTEGVL